MARCFRDALTAVSMVKRERMPNSFTRRLIKQFLSCSLLLSGALIIALSIPAAHATDPDPNIKLVFEDADEKFDAAAGDAEQEEELTPQQQAFDDLLYQIDSGQMQLTTQQQFDEQLTKLGELVPEGDDDRRITYAYYQCVYGSLFDPAAGIELASTMLSDARAREDRLEEGVLYMCLAHYQDVSGNVSEALNYIEKSIAIGKELDDKLLMADGYVSRCGIRSFLGENDLALQDCIQAEKLYKASKQVDVSEGLIFDIGLIYRRLGFLDRAEKYLQRSQELVEELDLPYGKIRVALQQGFLEEQRGNYQQALEKYHYAQKVAEENKISSEMVAIRIALAGGYNLNGEYGKALQQLELADGMRNQLNNSGYDGMAAMQYGIALSNLEQPVQAEQFFKDAEAAMLEDNNKRYLAILYEAWAQAYERIGDSQQALDKYQQYMRLQRELDKQTQDQQTQVLRFEYDTERTELENERLQKEKELKEQQLASLEAAREWQTLAIILASLLALLLVIFSLRQVANSKRFKQMAHTDSLTGLANRRQIERACAKAMELAKQTGKPLSILMYDLDHFKLINDRHGHSIGDVVLTNLSNFSKELLRENDILGRTGGEEFLAILPNANLEQAIQVAERLRREVDVKQYTDIESDLNATISVGVTEYKPGESMDDLLHRVDEALYKAKENGRNRVEYVV